MMQWIDIAAFRGLEGLRLDDLGRVNLLLGPNNSGKTSVLEAISIAAAPESRETWVRAGTFRGSWPFARHLVGREQVQGIEWLFPRRDGAAERLRLETDTGVASAGVTRLVAPASDLPDGFMPFFLAGAAGRELAALPSRRGVRVALRWTATQATTGDDEREWEFWDLTLSGEEEDERRASSLVMLNGFSHRHEALLQTQVSALIKAGRKRAIVELLGRMDPDLRDLHILADDDRGHGIFVEHARLGVVPLTTFGDGMRRTLHFAAGVIQARGGVLLIDEIEIAIHTSVIGSIFDWLVDACVEHDTQLFVTTHSLEAVDAILAGRSESLDDIVSYRLEDGRLQKRLSGAQLHRLRFKRGLEVRG